MAYFPGNTTWYDIYTGERINETHSTTKLDAPLSKINAHIRGGYILPLQDPSVTTTQRYLYIIAEKILHVLDIQYFKS